MFFQVVTFFFKIIVSECESNQAVAEMHYHFSLQVCVKCCGLKVEAISSITCKTSFVLTTTGICVCGV